MNNQTAYTASVKVMRSYDYCHFEIVLGSTEPLDLVGVDAMRKEAARLADKAVEQYKIAKRNAAKLLSEKEERKTVIRRAERIRGMAETDLSPEQQAELKAFDDQSWELSRRYDYDDVWPDAQDDD